MKEVKLTNMTNEEIQVLQYEVFVFSEAQKMTTGNIDINAFLDAMLTMDVALRLWYTFRKKVEGTQQKYTVRLKVFEACTVLKCCMWNREDRKDYEKHVVEKFKTLIDQQLKSI